jgi:hypothetical protein
MTQPLLPFVVANPPTPALFTQLGADKGTALAGTGIETKRLVSRIAEIIVAIFGRAATIFVRTKSKITCTSLLE